MKATTTIHLNRIPRTLSLRDVERLQFVEIEDVLKVGQWASWLVSFLVDGIEATGYMDARQIEPVRMDCDPNSPIEGVEPVDVPAPTPLLPFGTETNRGTYTGICKSHSTDSRLAFFHEFINVDKTFPDPPHARRLIGMTNAYQTFCGDVTVTLS